MPLRCEDQSEVTQTTPVYRYSAIACFVFGLTSVIRSVLSSGIGRAQHRALQPNLAPSSVVAGSIIIIWGMLTVAWQLIACVSALSVANAGRPQAEDTVSHELQYHSTALGALSSFWRQRRLLQGVYHAL